MPCCRFSREGCDQGILYDVRAWSVRVLRSTEVASDGPSKGRESILSSFPIRPAWSYMKRKTARMGKRSGARRGWSPLSHHLCTIGRRRSCGLRARVQCFPTGRGAAKPVSMLAFANASDFVNAFGSNASINAADSLSSATRSFSRNTYLSQHESIAPLIRVFAIHRAVRIDARND